MRHADALESRTMFAIAPVPLATSFGNDGKVLADLGETGYVQALLVQPDGKILVAANETTLLRYRPDGSPDPSFGTNGRVTLPAPETMESIGDLALTPDGKILIAGWMYPIAASVVMPQMPDSDTLLMRLNPDGSVDSTFGEAGRRVLDLSGDNLDDEAHDVTFDAQGRIVLAGELAHRKGDPYSNGIVPTTTAFMVARLSADGALDTTFGPGGAEGDGVAATEFGPAKSIADSVTILPDGKILAGGTEDQFQGFDATDEKFALARYNPDGTADTTFGGGDGMISTFVDDNWRVHLASMNVLPDGKILCAGSTTSSETYNTDFAFARFNADGFPDPSFFSDGDTRYDPGQFICGAADGALAADGTLYVTGVVSELAVPGGEPVDRQFAVLRLGPDGTIQLQGADVTPGDSDVDRGTDVAVTPDGSLVIAGNALPGTAAPLGQGGVQFTSGDMRAAVVRTRELGAGPFPEAFSEAPVTVDGTDGNDVITIALDAPRRGGSPALLVTVNGTTTRYPYYTSALTVRGGGGNDLIRAVGRLRPVPMIAAIVPAVAVILDGGPGNDRLRASAVARDLSVYTLVGGDGDDLLVGSPRGDTLDGGAGSDRLFGRAGADTLAGGTGRDWFFGGAGEDTSSDADAGDVVRLVENKGTFAVI